MEKEQTNAKLDWRETPSEARQSTNTDARGSRHSQVSLFVRLPRLLGQQLLNQSGCEANSTRRVLADRAMQRQ